MWMKNSGVGGVEQRLVQLGKDTWKGGRHEEVGEWAAWRMKMFKRVRGGE